MKSIAALFILLLCSPIILAQELPCGVSEIHRGSSCFFPAYYRSAKVLCSDNAQAQFIRAENYFCFHENRIQSKAAQLCELSCNEANPNVGLQVSTGETHSCGLMNKGKIICWGNNFLGQKNVAPLEGIEHYTQVSTGQYHSCALSNLGQIKCWGSNEYQAKEVPELQENEGVYVQIDTAGYYN